MTEEMNKELNEEVVQDTTPEVETAPAVEEAEAPVEETAPEAEEKTEEKVEEKAEEKVEEKAEEPKEASEPAPKKKFNKKIAIIAAAAAAVVVAAVAIILAIVLGGGSKASVKDFNKAATATSPEQLMISVQQDVSGIVLEAQFAIVYNEDGSATITYYRDVINDANVDTDEVKTRISGTVTCDASGNYSDGGEFAGNIPAAKGKVSFKFQEKKMKYTITSGGDVLNATVKAANTESVLGVAMGADTDITVTKADGKIVSFTMSYTTAQGPVSVNCFYN